MNPFMSDTDPANDKITRALIRDPRLSDNAISEQTNVPARTVTRKRKSMEAQGLLHYFTSCSLNAGVNDTEYHIYLIRLRQGISAKSVLHRMNHEPRLATVFTKYVSESHLVEIDGMTAILLFINGSRVNRVMDIFQQEIVPELVKRHGSDCIDHLTTMRLVAPLRLHHNYLPGINLTGAKLHTDWPDEGLHVPDTP
jgi:DNA-binding Lrp family transcriptional regulator